MYLGIGCTPGAKQFQHVMQISAPRQTKHLVELPDVQAVTQLHTLILTRKRQPFLNMSYPEANGGGVGSCYRHADMRLPFDVSRLHRAEAL